MAFLRTRDKIIALASAFALTLGGCSRPSDHTSQYRNISDQGWLYGDTLTFAPEHYNSLCKGDFVVAVRHDSDYPFTQLWLELTTTDETHRVRRDTLRYDLVDRHSNWIGHGIGTSFQLTDTVTGFRHPTGVPVTVRHIMRTDTLTGISQVGVFFVPQE